MSLIIEYSELNSTLTPEQNAANIAKADEIIRKNQLRSTGFTDEEIQFIINSRKFNHSKKWHGRINLMKCNYKLKCECCGTITEHVVPSVVDRDIMYWLRNFDLMAKRFEPCQNCDGYETVRVLVGYKFEQASPPS